MKTVILCGGKGIRLRDISGDLAKPMVRIGHYPIVQHIMNIYTRYGYTEFILCLGYQSWSFKEYFLNFRAMVSDVTVDFNNPGKNQYHDGDNLPPWKITLAETGLEAMTGCRVKRIQHYIGNETFMLTYGDGLASIDIAGLVKFHRAHGRLATITSVRPPSRFGELQVDNGVVTQFMEKPQSAGGLINGGFFIFEPGVFDYVTDDENCVLERQPLAQLAADGQLMAYNHEGFWLPMDTSREYHLLNRLWNERQPPWETGPGMKR
jgi:glucose-1-phosphate cytidylyltransferase